MSSANNSDSFSFDLSLDRGGFRLSAKADLPFSSITVILGKSGSGKTTLLRCLAGLESHVSGNIAFGSDTWLSSNIRIPTHHRHYGYVFQHAALFPHLDVQGNLEYALTRATSSEFEYNSIVDLIGIRDLIKRDVESLSGGERQRVALARTLLSGAKVLLLDEPFASLDAQARDDLLSLIEQVAQQYEVPILYVTHTLTEAVRLADHVVILENGKITRSGYPRDVFSSIDMISDLVDEPQSVIECVCESIDEKDHIGTLSFDGGQLHIPDCQLAPGTRIRALIKARDISLALDPPRNISILNAIKCTVSSITEYNNATNLITLHAHDHKLQALITKRSTRDLALVPNKPIYALLKAVSLAR